MKKLMPIIALTLAVLLLAGCAGRNRNDGDNAAQSPSDSPVPSPDDQTNSDQTTGDASGADSTFLVNMDDGTEYGRTLRISYDPAYFEPAETDENEKDRVRLHVIGANTAQTVLVRVSPSANAGDPDVRDYYMLQELDDAKDEDIRSTTAGDRNVSYYVSSSNIDSDGYNRDVYFSLRVDENAVLCGVVGIEDIAQNAPDNNNTDMNNFFPEDIAQEFFSKLFVDVTESAYGANGNTDGNSNNNGNANGNNNGSDSNGNTNDNINGAGDGAQNGIQPGATNGTSEPAVTGDSGNMALAPKSEKLAI